MRAVLALALTACTPLGPVQKLPGGSTRVVEATIPISSREGAFVGFAKYPRQTSRKLTFTLPDNTEYLMMSSCARHQTVKAPGRQYTLEYIPTRAESSRFSRSQSCPLEIMAIDNQGREHWGVVDFGDDSTLEARIDCNMTPPHTAKGFSICQVDVGKLMMISFDDVVIPYSSELLPECPAPTPGHKFGFQEGKIWEVTIGPDLCVYGFVNKDRKRHRLTTRGWHDAGVYR